MIPGINKEGANNLVGLLEERLVAAGYRSTLPRQAVLRQVSASCGASFTASELLESVNRASPEVGRATVFRTLELLVDLGVLQRVHTETSGNWGHSYMLCGLGDTHHHHLVCTACGQIRDIAGCLLPESLVRAIEDQASFTVDGHHLEFYGRCRGCTESQQDAN